MVLGLPVSVGGMCPQACRFDFPPLVASHSTKQLRPDRVRDEILQNALGKITLQNTGTPAAWPS